MKILVVGSGGREHSLIWKLSQSDKKPELHCAPGNAGIADLAGCHDIPVDDVIGQVNLAKRLDVDLVVVGPELPLTLGLIDKLDEEGIKAVGPTAEAAQLESSKGFMKDLCADNEISTALYKRFSQADEAIAFLDGFGKDVVIKADGLASGKGVIIPKSLEEAKDAVRDILSGDAFGEAGSEIVIEEFLDGVELSFFALSDGKNVIPFGSAEDFKRAYDGGKGPNTGGMGALSPSPKCSPELQSKIMSDIIEPTFKGLKDKNIDFKGVLYAGIMIVEGEPKLLEYNVRFGDPECQVLMMRLENDLVDIFEAIADQKLKDVEDDIKWSHDLALTVVVAAEGYPENPEKGLVIGDLHEIHRSDNFEILHAGTKRNNTGDLVNTGGRVFNFTARAADIQLARSIVYTHLDDLDWKGGFYRKDIGNLKEARP